MPWLEDVRREFVARLGTERMAHAFLLEGPMGTGKLRLAKEFASSLMCLEATYPACGHCRSCQLIVSGAHPDYREVTYQEHPTKAGEHRSEIVIDQVRQLISSLQLTTTISQRKVALIHPAEAMNRNAANALLKTLEEPPGDTIMLLLSHDPGRLAVTIRSRCQGLHVRMPEENLACEWLMKEAGISGETAMDALRSAAGSPLRARAMLEQGGAEQFRMVSSILEELLKSPGDSGKVLSRLAEIEPADLWNWLSLYCAEKLRRTAITTDEDEPLSLDRRGLRALAELQLDADKNRSLLPSPVRKDLLLQSWLIQWTRLTSDKRL